MTIVRNVNSKLVEQVVATKCQCWENGQYLRRDMLEVVGMPMSNRDNAVSVSRFVMSFRKLTWTYVVVTFKGVIVLRIKTDQLSNLPTKKIVFKF